MTQFCTAVLHFLACTCEPAWRGRSRCSFAPFSFTMTLSNVNPRALEPRTLACFTWQMHDHTRSRALTGPRPRATPSEGRGWGRDSQSGLQLCKNARKLKTSKVGFNNGAIVKKEKSEKSGYLRPVFFLWGLTEAAAKLPTLLQAVGCGLILPNGPIMDILRVLTFCIAAAVCAAKPPNIIFILSDDLGYGDVSISPDVNRTNMIPTPNIQRLADNGLRFLRGYSAQVCAPSRCVLMTGLHSVRFVRVS